METTALAAKLRVEAEAKGLNRIWRWLFVMGLGFRGLMCALCWRIKEVFFLVIQPAKTRGAHSGKAVLAAELVLLYGFSGGWDVLAEHLL